MSRTKSDRPPAISAGIRTPTEVIALPLEEAMLDEFVALSEEVSRRLAIALKSVSSPGTEVVIRATKDGILEWGTLSVTREKSRT